MQLTVADSPDVFGVGRIPEGPMLHLDLLSLLCLPHGIHEDIHGTLGRHLRIAVQYRHSQDNAKAILTCVLVLPEDSMLTVQLGLPVKVRRTGGRIRVVRGVARSTREYVVGRDVDQEDSPAGTELGQLTRGLDIELAGPLGVLVDLVWKAVCRACTREGRLSERGDQEKAVDSRRSSRTVHHNLRPGNQCQ